MLKQRVGQQTLRRRSTRSQHSSERAHTAHIAKPAQKSRTTKQQPDYEKLGRLLFAIGETGSKNRAKLYRIAFWKGVWGGLGGVVGATIVVSILLFVFNVLGSVPLIGEFIDIVEKSIPSNNLE